MWKLGSGDRSARVRAAEELAERRCIRAVPGIVHAIAEDPEEDIASGVWAGVVPLTTAYGEPATAPDCDAATPVPASVRAMTGLLSNARGR